MVVLGLTSCSEKPLSPEIDVDLPQGKVAVQLAVKTPSTTLPQVTKRDLDHENLVRDIQVLVFEEGIYTYKVPGINLVNSGANTTFKALLTSSDKPVKLYILANVTAEIGMNEPVPGENEAQVQQRLSKSFTAEGLQTAFPMFGEYTFESGLSTGKPNSVSGVKLLRGIARVDVIKAESLDNFTLQSVQLYRANNLIQLIPKERDAVTAPSIPAVSEASVTTIPVDIPGDMSQGQVYLPESAAPSDLTRQGTCVVIGASYAGGETSYYRMDFNINDAENVGQILRNYRYIFRIVSVAGPGWSSPDAAANNSSSNISVEIQAWDENTADMHFDGSHHFGVSAREMVFNYKEGQQKELLISTDLDHYTMQWADAEGNPTGAVSESMLNDYFTVAMNADQDIISVKTRTRSGYDDPDKVSYILLTAGRWKILITLRQLPQPVPTKRINVLTFNVGLGYLGSNTTVPTTPAQARGAGLRPLLTNKANFGPTGTVRFGGFGLLSSNTSANNLTMDLFESADIIYLHYMANDQFGKKDAALAKEWVQARQDRVLILSFDAADVNQNIRSEFGMTNITYSSTYKGPYSMYPQTDPYFTTTGPFTVNNPVPEGFQLRCGDQYWGEVSIPGYPNIMPILTGPNGNLVLGVDFQNRIVYSGDVDIFTEMPGTGATDDNHINNTTGNVNNNASRLIANLWAWMSEVVLNED